MSKRSNILTNTTKKAEPYPYSFRLIVAQDIQKVYDAWAHFDPTASRGFAARYVGDHEAQHGVFFFASRGRRFSDISHEAFHATHRVMEYVGCPITPLTHEPFAYFLDSIVDWITDEFRKAGVKLR